MANEVSHPAAGGPTIARISVPLFCINLARSADRRERMERRFAEAGIEGRAHFVEAVDTTAAGAATESSKFRAGQGCFASHLAAMRAILEDPVSAGKGGVVLEDDVLLRHGFGAEVDSRLENLPRGVPICLLGYLLASGFPDFSWAGRDPSRHDLCRALPRYQWGTHAYWISPDHARGILDEYDALDTTDLPPMTETFTEVPGAFVSWPALALQEATDSIIRPFEDLEKSHVGGQTRWRYADYASPAEPPSPLAKAQYEEPTIGLCMIVRDEAGVIERCLDSVSGLIDSWTICDTGSTDGTPEMIEARLAGIPGTLHSRPWRDFGANRTELVELAKGTADYLLLIDADMTVEWRGPLPELSADSYLLRHDGDLGYWTPRLVRGDRDWLYEGVTHEYLACRGDHTEAQLNALLIEHHADGGTRGEKFERDRKLLEAELEREPDNDRATFYLAQTYRDIGETALAIEHYRRRIALGGWQEEMFYAALQVAELTARDDPRASIPLFLEAFELRPARAEALHQAAYVCRVLGWHNTAYTFARMAVATPEPDDVLFVSRDTYRWGALFELSFAAHMTERHDEAMEHSDTLLDGRELPKAIETAIRENRRRLANVAGGGVNLDRRSEPALSDLAPSTRVAEIKVDVEPDWPQFNPSIAADGDGFRMIVRTSNYRLRDGVYTMLDESGEIRTINYLVRLDKDLNLIDIEPIHGGSDDLERHDFPVRGLEDCRIFQHAGRWYATASSRELDPEGVCRIVLLSLDEGEITDARILPGPQLDRHEKNWMPFSTDDGLLFVYTSSPSVVVRVDPDGGEPERIHEHEAPTAAREFRGGSQGVTVEGGTLFAIHEAFDFGGPRRYMHRLVLFDREWRLKAATPRFHFTDQDVEVCTGMARRGSELVLSFGVGDFAAALAVCNEAEVLATLKPIATALAV